MSWDDPPSINSSGILPKNGCKNGGISISHSPKHPVPSYSVRLNDGFGVSNQSPKRKRMGSVFGFVLNHSQVGCLQDPYIVILNFGIYREFDHFFLKTGFDCNEYTLS